MARRDEPRHTAHSSTTAHPPHHAAPAHGPHHHHHHHDFSDVSAHIERFEAPERVTWQKPAEVIATLAIARGSKVADLGAGTGYFTIALARAVGPRGVCYAVDTEPAMLAHVARRAEAERAPKIVTVTATADDPCLPEPVDLAFTCNTYHHFEHRKRWAKHLVAQLAPGGRVAVVDWHKRTLRLGPPNAIKLASSTVVHELGEVGLRLLERHAFLPHQYFLIFGR